MSPDDTFTLFSNFPNTATSQDGAALNAEQPTHGDCWAAPEDIALQYDLITEWDDRTGNFSSPQDRQQFREYPINAQNSLSIPKSMCVHRLYAARRKCKNASLCLFLFYPRSL